MWFVVSINDCSSKCLYILSFNICKPNILQQRIFQLGAKPSCFISFEAGFYLLHLTVPNSGPRRDYKQLIPHLLSPDHL